MDRLQSMRVFVKVVEQGGFARAGEVLDISNAVITRHVADLEQHLGIRLLNRTTRKLSLTEPGQAYLDRVKRILSEIDEAEAIASAGSKRPTGTLRIYSLLGFGKQQLAELLPAYSAQNPEVKLDVTLSDRTVDIVEEGFDIGIFHEHQKFDARMIARQLGVTEFLLCASPAYVATHGEPKVPQDVAEHACLNFSSVETLRNHWPLLGLDSLETVPVTNKLLSNNADLLRHCAAAGMGLIFAPSYSLSDDLRSKRLVRLLPDIKFGQMSMIMVYPSRHLLSAKVRSFVDFMNTKFPYPQSDPWIQI